MRDRDVAKVLAEAVERLKACVASEAAYATCELGRDHGPKSWALVMHRFSWARVSDGGGLVLTEGFDVPGCR